MRFFSSLLLALFYILLTMIVIAIGVYAAGGVPKAWDPFAPLDLSERPRAFESLKIRRALDNDENCRAALATGNVQYSRKDDFVAETNAQCGIEGRISLQAIDDVALSDFETRCDMALRLALWVEWDLQEIAAKDYGSTVRSIEHFGSYNCRQMRTSSGATGRMSKHATARAIDISAITLSNGRRFVLTKDWSKDPQNFLRQARDAACNRFPLVLSPDYNALHADHFHLEEGGWLRCR